MIFSLESCPRSLKKPCMCMIELALALLSIQVHKIPETSGCNINKTNIRWKWVNNGTKEREQ